MFKNTYIRFLLFWEEAMYSLTESWKECNIESNGEYNKQSEHSSEATDMPNGDILHVVIKGEN